MKSLAAACLLAICTSGHAANWAQWRGPLFNGSTTESDLPHDWSTTKNVVWSADLPGGSASTPIVWDDHVFVSSTDMANDTLCAMSFDRRLGQLRWKHDVAQGVRKDSRSTFAAPSPATNGQVVVFFFGNGQLVAYDFAGQQLWSRNIQEDYGQFAFLWTFSSSPVFYDDKLYLQVLQRDEDVQGRGFTDRENESYLLALQPETGKTLWRQVRPSQAVGESREAFTTPVPYEYNGRQELLIAGGDLLSGHDPQTGKELWRWGTWNPGRITHWRLVPSPVAGDGVILACAPKKDPIYAIRAGRSGNLDEGAIAWVSESARDISADVPTPAFYDGDFFVLSDVRKSLSRVDPQTGKAKWTMRTPGVVKYEASPLLADGKAYLINFDGDVVVVDASDGRILNQISMDQRSADKVRASIVAAQGQLFVRTSDRLFCIAKP